MARPEFAPEQEVRFAVVMYGGVSLAIYINGVVQELFRLVRATAPEFELPAKPHGQQAYFDTNSLEGTERVYRKLGQMLRINGDPESVKEGEDPPIRTRFVIDILSGSSAGDINALFLGKAIANQQNIDGLRNLWISEADVADLLNDRQSQDGARRFGPQQPPRSLLNSDRLYKRARAAFRGMAEHEERREDKFSPAYAEELNVSVTTTDLRGLRVPIQLHDNVVYESRHKNVLRFVYASARASGEMRNDFVPENDDLLAFAARCTSAFPFAFEPAVARETPHTDGAPDIDAWDPFFPEYVARGEQWQKYAFADGGYLDNKPFSYATDDLRRRRADVPVQRKLLYIEPDPTGEPLAPNTEPKPGAGPGCPPDALDNVVAGITLPRVETIREDVQAVVDRNRTVERIRRLTRELRKSVLDDKDPRSDPLGAIHALHPDTNDSAVDAALECPQLMYTPYLRLREEMVVDDLAYAFVRLGGGQDRSDEVEAMRILIRRVVTADWEGKRRAFLMALDVRFRLRRLAFVQDRMSELLRGTDAEPAVSVSPDRLHEAKRKLNVVFVELRSRGRSARSRPEASEERARQETPREVLEMRVIARGARLDQGLLAGVLGAREEKDVPAVPAVDKAIRDLLQIASDHLAPAMDSEYGSVQQILQDHGTPRLAEYYRRFESFDMVMLPLTYPGLEEVNPVDVLRIAPEDAISLINEGKQSEEGKPRPKLAGTSMGHFGGFLDKGWRRNDLLWGRLDGAERLLEALLPDGKERDRLRDEAHAAIIRDELIKQDAGPLTDLLAGALGHDDAASDELLETLRDPSRADALLDTLHDDAPPTEARMALLAALMRLSDKALLDQVREHYEVPRELDPQRTMSSAGRAATIGGKLFEQASRRRSWPPKPGFWLARIGRLVWGVAEVAVPGARPARIPALLFRHWALVAMALGVILILAGALGVEAAARVGWILLIGAVVARVVVWLVGGALTAAPVDCEPASRWRRLGKGWPWLVALAGLLVVVAGAIWNDDVQKFGWFVLAAGLLLGLAVWAWAVPHRRRVRAAAAVGLTALAGTAAVGAGHIADDIGKTEAWECFDEYVWPWGDGSDCGGGGGGGGQRSTAPSTSTRRSTSTGSRSRSEVSAWEVFASISGT